MANAAVGYDNIDVASAHAMGITVCNTPGVLDDTTADLAFLLILAATRLATDAERDLREGRWKGWGFGTHLARDVHGATLGLVGFGRIARAVAHRADGFNMEVIHTARHDTGVTGFVPTLDELLERSDIVSLHVPLSESTRHLIGVAELARMKSTAVLINTARGPVVDEDALVDALENGTIYSAGLDVFDGEPKVNPRLLSAPRATLLPHIGSATIAHADPYGPPGVPGSLRRLGGTNAPERRCSRPATRLATRLARTVHFRPDRQRDSTGVEGYDPAAIRTDLRVEGGGNALGPDNHYHRAVDGADRCHRRTAWEPALDAPSSRRRGAVMADRSQLHGAGQRHSGFLCAERGGKLGDLRGCRRRRWQRSLHHRDPERWLNLVRLDSPSRRDHTFICLMPVDICLLRRRRFGNHEVDQRRGELGHSGCGVSSRIDLLLQH